jgi:hypothetical protein
MIKSVIKKADQNLLGGRLRRWKIDFYNSEFYQRQCLNKLSVSLDHKMVVHYQRNAPGLLPELCDKYGSDKGERRRGDHPYPWPAHTFADYYSRLFDHHRHQITKVFECGLGTNNPALTSSMGIKGRPGASLRVWRDYFPNAQVFGADIDRDILFCEERIKTFYLDQTSPEAVADYWRQVGAADFDFMLDDGLHTFAAGVCLFENSIARLSKQGIYVIEDVTRSDLLKFREYFEGKPYQVDYVNLVRPGLNLDTNSLVVIRPIPS